MTAHHFFATFAPEDDVVILRGDEARHAARALRIELGEEITVSNGLMVVRAVVIETGDAEVRAEVRERTAHEVRPENERLTVCPAVPKGGKLDEVIEDLTELGVDVIAPWFAARSIPEWDALKRQRAVDRWHKVAFAASKQSKRVSVTHVMLPGPPPHGGDGMVVLHEAAVTRLRDVPGRITAVVAGPEGGLTDDEISTFASHGATIASLGPQILRTETAAVAAATLVLARGGRLG